MLYLSITTIFPFLDWAQYEHDLDHKGSQNVLHGYDDRRKKEVSS